MDDAGELDRRFLAAAIRLGAGANGTTWPNPAVGAILVRDGAVVGCGRTAPGGRPHAEELALARAGERARGATCYVSLEPCGWRSAPGAAPCADRLVAAGVRRVVTALRDPNSNVDGAGMDRLEAAGVEVVTSKWEAQARRAHRGHLARVSLGRPFVTLKLAVSADGCIGRLGERQAPVTGEAARRHVHALRARHDAVMVGRGTVVADDPLLTCRLPGLEHRSPVRIVAAGRGAIDSAAAVLIPDSPVPTWIVAPAAAPPDALPPPRVRWLKVAAGPGGVDLPEALAALGRCGLTSVLVEGGAGLARGVLEADLVDEALIFRSPAAIGEGGVPALAGLPLSVVESAGGFRPRERLVFGEDRMVRYERVR